MYVVSLQQFGTGHITASGQGLSIADVGCGDDLADLERLLLRRRAADQLLNPNVAFGLDIELALGILDLDDDIAVGLDFRQSPHKNRRARNLQGICRQRNGDKVLRFFGNISTQGDAAGQPQGSCGLNVDRR